MKIIIFVRQGCCICGSLKNKLAKIKLSELFPNLEELKEIDIDRFDLYKDKYKKYNYEVPVIAVEGIRSEEIIELPRISPRLKDDQLKNWLQKNISTILEK
nr:glutaredoxin family protein [Prochlorococcus marinus]